jgi:outer membrane receptor for ferrienterochelin and colicins
MRQWLFFAGVFWSALATGQSVPLPGHVTSQGNPVPFANVWINDLQMGTAADSAGHFVLPPLPMGRHTLRITAVGYQPLELTFDARADKPTRLRIEIKEDNAALDEIVVTGTMKEVTRLASPIAVDVFSPTFFRKNPTPNIFEALSIVNGVQPQINCNVCNTGDIHINGLEGPYTMILIDGMPIVSSLSTVYGLSGIPNSMVQRMEVVKGPASTLYGSEAVGGVINIITQDPIAYPALKVDVFGTSVGEYNVDLSGALKAGKHKGLAGVNYFNYTQPQDINHDNFTDVTLQKRFSLFNKWNFFRPSGLPFTLATRYVNEDRWGGELNWTPSYRGTDTYYAESIFTQRVEMIGKYAFAGIAGLTADFSYNYHQQDSWYGINPFMARQHVAFTQLRWTHSFGRHELLTGLPFRWMLYDDNTPGTATLSGGNEPAQTVLPGLFVQDEYKITRDLTLLMGGRYDHHNIHGNIFTGRGSVKYSPGPSSTFRLTSGTGYRVVNLFTEEHAALTGARAVVISHSLSPEKSWNANLGYSHQFTHGHGFTNLDISAFYTYFSNKIVGDFATDPNKIIFDNLSGHAVSRGLTVNADVSLGSRWKWIAGITLLDVYRIDHRIADDKIPQYHAPAWSGTFSLSYQSARSGFSADLTGRINGPMHLPVVPNDFRPESSPVYALLNLQVTKTINNRWEIYGGVKNLLNFIPSDPLLRPFDPFDRNVAIDNPFGYTFDTAYNYAPMQGAKGFLGVRYTLRKV